MSCRSLGRLALLTVLGACKVEPIETLELAEPSPVELPSTVLPLATERPTHERGTAAEAAPAGSPLAPLMAELSRGTEQTSRWVWDRIDRIERPRWLGGGKPRAPAPPAAHAPTPPPPSASPAP